MIQTHEGDLTYKNAINSCVEFFSKAGSLYDTKKKKSFYQDELSALKLFKKAWKDDAITSFKLLCWLRDCRGGAGNRSGARSIITWIANTYPEWIESNMNLIPLYGRFDDLTSLFKTPLRNEAGIFWANAIDEGDVLSAKWAKRHYKPIREALGLKESEFRKLLANIRKDHIVEHKMCNNQWENIEFKKVPSVAMSRYTKAFDRHIHDQFQAYKEALKKGKTTIHADVLFPHDCIRTALNGDEDIAEEQFNALPNYMEGTDEKIMVISDTSGSMIQIVGGSVNALHVSQGMALYCSSRLPTNSPFYKRFIGFCSEGRLVDWRKYTFKSAIRNRNVFDGAVGSTRIDAALNLILKIAKEKNVRQELMPTILLIVSDMQFSSGVAGGNRNLTQVEKCMEEWKEAGYKIPKVVYWNTAGYEGSPATVNHENVGLVSGFSPSICKAILGGKDFSPYGIMTRALEKYEITIPRSKEK